MSRSYRKYPLISPSKKEDKRYASRLLRRHTKEQLKREVLNCLERHWKDMIFYSKEEDFIFPLPKEVYDLWWAGSGDSSCQFDPEKYPELMRK